MMKVPVAKKAIQARGICILAALVCLNLPAEHRELVEGNPASPVKVVIYEDLQCGDCLNFRMLLDAKLLPKYGARVAFLHRDFPLPRHDWARPAAVAARWVQEQNPGLAIVFRREIMSEQNHITTGNLKPWIMEFAVRNGLDPNGILHALEDPRLNAMVDQDYQGGVARGLTRTPTVIVGGQKLVETILYDDVARALDTELAR
jgi:protein-disulfide isomerase